MHLCFYGALKKLSVFLQNTKEITSSAWCLYFTFSHENSAVLTIFFNQFTTYTMGLTLGLKKVPYCIWWCTKYCNIDYLTDYGISLYQLAMAPICYINTSRAKDCCQIFWDKTFSILHKCVHTCSITIAGFLNFISICLYH